MRSCTRTLCLKNKPVQTSFKNKASKQRGEKPRKVQTHCLRNLVNASRFSSTKLVWCLCLNTGKQAGGTTRLSATKHFLPHCSNVILRAVCYDRWADRATVEDHCLYQIARVSCSQKRFLLFSVDFETVKISLTVNLTKALFTILASSFGSSCFISWLSV